MWQAPFRLALLWFSCSNAHLVLFSGRPQKTESLKLQAKDSARSNLQCSKREKLVGPHESEGASKKNAWGIGATSFGLKLNSCSQVWED